MIAAVTASAAFVALVDSTLVNLAVESVCEDFAEPLVLVQWIVTGYLISLAVSLPATAWLGNRYGYGRLWGAALIGFVVASALCAVAFDIWTLIAARVLQGLAGGLMVPAGHALIGSVAGHKQLGRVFGVLGFVVSLGPAIGPALGGAILEVASWRWLFWINVPIGLAALLVSQGLVPIGTRNLNRKIDLVGLALVATGIPTLLYGAIQFASNGFAGTDFAAIAIGAGLLILFVSRSIGSQNSVIDLSLLRRRRFLAATCTAGLSGANVYGTLLLLPLFFLNVAMYDKFQSGVLLLVMGLGTAIALPIAGWLTDRIGAGILTVAGTTMTLLSAIVFLFPAAQVLILLVLILVVRGAGVACVQMPAITAGYAAVSGDELGDASTLINIVNRIGGAIGATGMVLAIERLGGREDPRAYFGAFGIVVFLSAVTYIPTSMLLKR